MKVDVAIIGSGVSGLTAAALLARQGKSVVVLEKQKLPGGAIRRFRRNRIGFDVGFHYTGCLGEGEILDLLWRACGIRDRVDVRPVPDESYDHYGFSGGEESIRGYFDYERLEQELCSHFPADSDGIRTYLSEIRRICSEVPFYHPDLPLLPFLRGYKNRPRSLSQFLDEHIADHRLRGVLGAPAFLYGVPIQKCALEKHAMVVHGYYSGAYTVYGGGQAVVDGFLEVLEHSGTQLMTDCGVEGIAHRNGKVSGVVTSDGERIDCDEVIYSGHPARLPGLLEGSLFRPAYRKRLEGLENSLSMYILFGRSEREIKGVGRGLNYYLLPAKGEVIEELGPPFGERPIMLTSTSGQPGSSLQSAENGIIVLRLGYWEDVARFAGSRPGDRSEEYLQFKRAVERELKSSAEERWGHLTGEIEPLAVGTPLTFRDELLAPEGCAYGAMHCLDQFNPEVRTRLPGLYLCGQSTLMTGVVGASISGCVAAGEILGLEPFWENLRKWV